MRQLSLPDIQLTSINLIEASAGTGKTWTIAALFMRLLLERGMKVDEILVVTYTRAAAAELKGRIRQRIADTLDLFASGREPADELEQSLLQRCPDAGQSRHILTRALFSFDSSPIYTIHGFCQRALSDNAFESGSLFDTEMIADQHAIVREAVEDFWRMHVLTRSDEFIAQMICGRQTPQKMLLKLKGQLQNEEISIIPARHDVDFTQAARARDNLFRQAGELWKSEQENIRGLLLKPGLKQNVYKPEQVAKAAAVVDSWFRGPSAHSCDKLELFTTGKLSKSVNKGFAAPQHHFFDLCQSLLEACRAAEDCFEQQITNLLHQLHDWLKTELPRRKQTANLRCYDDLLLDLRTALQSGKGQEMAERLRQRYKAAMIDEFQDTDRLQWQIFRQLSDAWEYPLFLIGDPKQAIYSFRGADIHAYLAAAECAGENRWTLDTNRRSVNDLVTAVNRLLSSSKDPFLFSRIDFQPVKSGRATDDQLLTDGRADNTPLRFWIYPASDSKKPNKPAVRSQAAEAVAAEICRLLDGSCQIRQNGIVRALQPGDIAVLVRTHSQAELIRQTLSEAGLRSVQFGSMTIFKTDEAVALWRILRSLASPGNAALMREALLCGLFGINANRLDEIMRDDRLWDSWVERFRTMQSAFQRGGLHAMTLCLLYECEVLDSLLSGPDGERAVTNLLHCAEMVHGGTAGSGNGLDGCITWLGGRITGRFEDETSLLRLESDDDAVRIATIHASKGLQYPVVFMPFAWEGSSALPDQVIFHDEDSRLILDVASRPAETSAQKCLQEKLAEDLRLLYVALTRAEYRCYVIWGNLKHSEQAPLYRLLHSHSGKPFSEYSTAEIAQEIIVAAGPSAGIATTVMTAGCHTGMTATADASVRPPLTCSRFESAIVSDWRISSFSSLSGSGGHESRMMPRDIDAVMTDSADEAPRADTDKIAETLTMFDFPKGAAAGTCLHELLERVDFCNATAEHVHGLVSDCLPVNGYGPEWFQAVGKMVMDLLAAEIIPDCPGMTLGQLSPGAWRSEMEFFLSLKTIDATCLQGIFDGQLHTSRHGDFASILSGLRLQQSRGMLVGYIDMIFKHGDRYYIIDWKSNHLGNSIQAYTPERLRDAMAGHAYILQYHLYTLALDRLLAARIPDYDYDRHFGGIIYVFLRAVSSRAVNHGCFFDRPSREFVKQANLSLLA